MATYDRDFRGLDRQRRLQSAPLGTTAATRPDAVSGPVGQQYRRQQEDYSRALRLLRRQANKDNDPDAAIAMIGVREKANEAGFSPGGIRQRDEFNAGIRGRANALGQAAGDRERTQLLDRRLVDEELEDIDNPTSVRPVYSRPSLGARPLSSVDRGKWWERKRSF